MTTPPATHCRSELCAPGRPDDRNAPGTAGPVGVDRVIRCAWLTSAQSRRPRLQDTPLAIAKSAGPNGSTENSQGPSAPGVLRRAWLCGDLQHLLAPTGLPRIARGLQPLACSAAPGCAVIYNICWPRTGLPRIARGLQPLACSAVPPRPPTQHLLDPTGPPRIARGLQPLACSAAPPRPPTQHLLAPNGATENSQGPSAPGVLRRATRPHTTSAGPNGSTENSQGPSAPGVLRRAWPSGDHNICWTQRVHRE